MKHIGILAHSAEGSALCYLTACHEGEKHLGPHLHPPITMDVIAMGETLSLYEKGKYPEIRSVLIKTVERLAAAGCDFFVCPDNTAHLALEADGDPFPIPGLHIGGVVARAAKDQGYNKVGILGTLWTMEGPIYPNAFSDQNIESKIPTQADMATIQNSIFDELCQGIFNPETTKHFIQVIEDLKKAGCDAVLLGCTEIPLIINDANSPLPTLDSTRLLAKAAVEVALNKRPMPAWTTGRLFS